MPRPAGQTSIHGSRLSLTAESALVINDARAGLVNGILRPQAGVRVLLDTVAVRAAFTTPIELVPAPGAGFVILVSRVTVSKAAGTAYGGIAAGEDITIVYAGGTAPVVTNIETTGFLDSTADELRITRAVDVANGFDLTGLANTAIDFELLLAAITLGSDLVVDVDYERISLDALLI